MKGLGINKRRRHKESINIIDDSETAKAGHCFG